MSALRLVTRALFTSSFVVAALCAAGPQTHPLTSGQDLSGWRQVAGSAPYRANGHEIIGRTVVGSPNSFLATEGSYGDFILELEFMQEGDASNGGVQFRSEIRSDYQDGRVHGYQFDIDPSDRGWTGGIYDEGRRGWLYPVDLNPPAKSLYQLGEWNRIRIEAIGPTLRTWLNDCPVAHVIDDRTPAGFIALQVHSIGSRSANAGRPTRWRNIRIQTEDVHPSPPDATFIRNLIPNYLTESEQDQGWKLLWDGRTPGGWRSEGGEHFSKTGWQISNGELIANDSSSGSSGIVTEEIFTAFDFQAEFKLTPGAEGGIRYGPFEFLLIADGNLGKANEDPTRTLGSLAGRVPRGKMPGGLGVRPRVGEWQHARIVVNADGSLEHWLNGIRVVSHRAAAADLPRTPMHVTLAASHHEVRFRSIKIRRLGTNP